MARSGIFRHYKGDLYAVLCEAQVEATGEWVIVYQNTWGERFVRPRDEFLGLVEVEGQQIRRFAMVSETGRKL